MADRGSFFEIGPPWGTDQIAGFARFNGYPMGVIASDCRHVNGGALTADGCDKLKRHLDLNDRSAHTRRWVCEWVENAYRIVSQPGSLGPRAVQFRP